MTFLIRGATSVNFIICVSTFIPVENAAKTKGQMKCIVSSTF